MYLTCRGGGCGYHGLVNVQCTEEHIKPEPCVCWISSANDAKGGGTLYGSHKDTPTRTHPQGHTHINTP